MAHNEYYYCVWCDNNHRMGSQISNEHKKKLAKKRKSKRGTRR